MIIKLILLIIIIIIYSNPKIDNENKIKMLSITLFIIVLTMPNYNLFFEGFNLIKKEDNKKECN
jgi:hypothetical protein